MKKRLLLLALLLCSVAVSAQDYSTPYFDVDRMYFACDAVVPMDDYYAQNFRDCMNAFYDCNEEYMEPVIGLLVRAEYKDEVKALVWKNCDLFTEPAYYPESMYGRAVFFDVPKGGPSAGVVLGALLGVIGVFVMLTLVIYKKPQ